MKMHKNLSSAEKLAYSMWVDTSGTACPVPERVFSEVETEGCEAWCAENCFFDKRNRTPSRCVAKDVAREYIKKAKPEDFLEAKLLLEELRHDLDGKYNKS